MLRRPQIILLLIALFAFAGVCIHFCCQPKSSEGSPVALAYLNHHDTVKYVGMNTCRACHADKHSTFVHTGMGLSFDKATPEKSSANFKHGAVYDKYRDFYYQPYWAGDEFYIKEYRLEGKDTVHKRVERISYIVGSGQHTNSHIIETNGYLNQAPLTWYAQQGKWDLPPGFEDGHNTRFSRIIGLECMSCHNGLPGFVQGSENRFTKIPGGIDCERCHGPGQLHVAQIQAGKLVDTAKEIDYTIVNPRKLSWQRQIDLCQRCHLQGNAVLKEGKEFTDFRPGMVLSDYFEVFMPRYEGSDTAFIMASHAERLQMSNCFINSNKNAAQGKMQLTCITCHNPHVSVKVTGKQVFNDACINCHQQQTCTETEAIRKKANNDCSSCHMPSTGTIDIPHVTVHDHYIRKPEKKTLSAEQANKVARFIGIYSVNNPNTDALTKGRAYLSYFEKFEPSKYELLDSALFYLQKANAPAKEFIHHAFLKIDYTQLLKYVPKAENPDAWTAYRIGQAYYSTANSKEAEKYFAIAVAKAPQNIEFTAKLGTVKLELNKTDEAKKLFEELLKAYPKHTQSHTNLGYLYFLQGNIAKANEHYDKAVTLDPDYEPALLNKAGLYNYLKEYNKARQILQRILKRNPNNQRVKQMLESLKGL